MRYLHGNSTPLEYLKIISSTIGKENKRIDPSTIFLSQKSIDHISDEFTEPRCHVCLRQSKENFSLIHGGTAHCDFCEKCATELSRLNHECPICRGKIDKIVKIFQ